jgi:hypothetical protein
VKCPVVVAKLDRISRDVHLTSGLMTQPVSLLIARYRTSKLDCMGCSLKPQNADRTRPPASFCVPSMKALAIGLETSRLLIDPAR